METKTFHIALASSIQANSRLVGLDQKAFESLAANKDNVVSKWCYTDWGLLS